MFVYLLIAIATWWLTRWFSRRGDPEAEREALELVGCLDSSDASGDEEPSQRYERCVVKAVHHARCTLGTYLTDTLANRRVVDEKIRKYMLNSLEMRPRHVSLYAGRATALFFVPTQDDILTRRMEQTALVGRRKAAMGKIALLP